MHAVLPTICDSVLAACNRNLAFMLCRKVPPTAATPLSLSLTLRLKSDISSSIMTQNSGANDWGCVNQFQVKMVQIKL